MTKNIHSVAIMGLLMELVDAYHVPLSGSLVDTARRVLVREALWKHNGDEVKAARMLRVRVDKLRGWLREEADESVQAVSGGGGDT